MDGRSLLAFPGRPCDGRGGLTSFPGGKIQNGLLEPPGLLGRLNSREEGGWIDGSGNSAVIEISAPTTGDTANLALVYDRNNTQDMRLTGNGTSNYVGTIYGASAQLDFRGNGCGTQFKSLTVVDDVTFSGSNACFSADYDENFNVEIPPSGLALTQ